MPGFLYDEDDDDDDDDGDDDDDDNDNDNDAAGDDNGDTMIVIVTNIITS